jgi:pimeloyl-ACP methyl ester carboxylesterase
MTGLGERILERSAPGVLHTDLAACNAYANGIAAAALIKAPTLIVAGEKDQMTPLRNARALSAAIAGSRLVVLNGAGHMMLTERPDAVREALRDHLGAATLVRR